MKMNKGMKLVAFLFVVFLASGVFAQGINDVYSVNYFAHRNNNPGIDSTIRIINTGQQGTPITPLQGTVCADVFVFDANQEMIECCACPITANGLLTLSLINNLTQMPLTGFPAPDQGVIKIVSDNRANCNEASPVPVPDMRSWATHLNRIQGNFIISESAFSAAPLQPDELSFLGQGCSFVQYLGSGKGVCTCGTPEISE